MDACKRDKQPPIPDNLDQILNDLQLLALKKVEEFGWKLKFVRRPLFQDAIPVVESPDGHQVGVLEEGGTINTKPDFTIRD